MIALEGLAKAFGEQTLFRDVSLQLNRGCRYGLVGANGSGKTTLLHMLAGAEEPSEGRVSRPRMLRLGLLEQDRFPPDDTPILEVVMRGHQRLWRAIADKEALLERADEAFDGERYAELEDVVVSLDGYAFEARCGEILEGLGIATELHRRPIGTLSGGFALRVLLARVLASDPQCLLLDEPTNHLDILSIRWLERFLATYAGCAVVVSHDRRFLDNVCTHILDVDYETIILYTGDYSRFTAAKLAERERREAERARRAKEIAAKEAFVERFRAKATKARQAQSRVKQLERLVLESLPPSSRRHPSFGFRQCRPSGKDVLELEGVSKAFDGRPVLDNVSLHVRRGDRLAVIGPNGIGKSTLLKIAVGRLEPDRGRVRWGHATFPGYFAQDHRELFGERDATVEAWLGEACPLEGIGFVRGELGRVLFSGDDATKRVTSLSGGEAARLVFARMRVERPNVMVLDEPTNHLDLEAIETLVDALRSFDGTIVFVSHDRWFVSHLATRVCEITATGINDYHGSYEDYVAACGDDHLDAETAARRLRSKRRRERGRRQPRGRPDPEAQRRARRAKELELRRDVVVAAIEEGERRLDELNRLFADPDLYEQASPDRLRSLKAEHDRVAARARELEEEWETIEAAIAKTDDDGAEA